MKVDFFVKVLEYSFGEDELKDEEGIEMKQMVQKLRKILVDVTVCEAEDQNNEKREQMVSYMKRFNEYLKNMKSQMKRNESTRTETIENLKV